MDDILQVLDRTKEVKVETSGRDGTTHQVPIWVLVIDREVYVASYKGKAGRWWRELLREGQGTFIAAGRRIRVRPHEVGSEATRHAMSAAFARKYPTSGASLTAMQTPEVLETALRLELVETVTR